MSETRAASGVLTHLILWRCLGATDWDHPPCGKRYDFGAWRIATHTRTSGNTDGRYYGDR